MSKISCKTCKGLCCYLEVALIDDSDDQVPSELVDKDIIGRMTMKRNSDGSCVALNHSTFLCTIYANRPYLCREYQAGDDDCLVERRALN